jgi:membrane protease YdiL (CAAX protease family)
MLGVTFDQLSRIKFGNRAAALLEVTLSFATVHFIYRSFKHFTWIGRLEGEAGLNFSPGILMILATIFMVGLRRKDFEEYGLTLMDWRLNLDIGLIWGIVPVIAAGVLVTITHVPINPGKDPGPVLALMAVAGNIVFAGLFLLMVRKERSSLRRPHTLISIGCLGTLVTLPILLAMYSQKNVLQELLTIAWLFIGAGFGEEIFFRGYIQSRINEAFGRPFRLMKAEFGMGLITASLFFGLIHALNPVDYFNGRWDFAWWWAVMNVSTGLFLGIMRERTGSVLPCAIAHGISDVLQEVPRFLL